MNETGQSVRFVIITTGALILVGLMFVAFGSKQSISGNVVASNYACYGLDGEKLVPLDVPLCCAAIKQSTGCKPYVSSVIEDSLYNCDGIIVNTNTIAVCN